MSAILCRMLVGTALFGAWLYLIATGRADPGSMLDFIKLTLAGLAAHIITKENPKP